jgi:hypothetical protein
MPLLFNPLSTCAGHPTVGKEAALSPKATKQFGVFFLVFNALFFAIAITYFSL